MHDADDATIALSVPGTRTDSASPPPSPQQAPIWTAGVTATLSALALILATIAHSFLTESYQPASWPSAVLRHPLGDAHGCPGRRFSASVPVLPFARSRARSPRHSFRLMLSLRFCYSSRILETVIWTQRGSFPPFLAVAWPITDPTLATTALTVICVVGFWISTKASTIVHGRDQTDLPFDAVSPRSTIIQHPLVFAAFPTLIVAPVAGLPARAPYSAHVLLLVSAAFFATLATGTLYATGGAVRAVVILALGISTVAVAAVTAVAGEWPSVALMGLIIGSALVLLASIAAAIRSARAAVVAVEYQAVPPPGVTNDVLVASKVELECGATRAPSMIAALVCFFAGLVLVAGTALMLHDGLRTKLARGMTNVRQQPLFSTQGTIRGLDPCANTRFERKEPHPSTNTTALVTGGAGFIGSHLVERLLSLGYRVRILDNLATGYVHNIAHLITHPAVEFIYGDIMDPTTVLVAVKGVDYVYHLAAMSKVAPSMKDPAMAKFCLDTNVAGTVNVLNASRIAGVKKVVYAASSTYYGNGNVPMNEADAPNLLTPYAATKYEGEIQMDLYDRIFNFPTISVRFFMVYGPRQPTTGAYAIVTGVFLKKWMDGEPLPIEGDGSHYRDFIHARDIANALILAQQSPHRGTVVNAGTGIGHSVKDVADLISPDQVHVAERKNDLVGTLANTCKAKKMLGFEADYDFTHEMTALIEDAADPVAHLAASDVQRLIEAHAAQPWLLPPGLLRPKYAPLINDLATLAEMQARDKQITVIPYQAADRPMLENLIYSLVKYGQTRHLLVAAIDEASLASCLAMNLPCFNATANSPSTFSGEVREGEGDGSARNSWIKPRVVDALLRLGFTVHLSATETAYVRNVWATYMPWLDEIDADLAATYESASLINTGNYIARPTLTMLNFFREYLAIGDRNPTIPEQTAFGTALRAHGGLCQTREACAALKQAGKLALRDYSSAFGRATSCSPDVLDVCARHVLYVRPNCIAGREAKKRTLVQLKVWFMREVCPAGAGEDPELHKGECMGVPSGLVSKHSVLPEPASPAEERECFGTVAQLTAEEPI
ncbi:hypothetical protein AMAG_02905 [Allomyces macrogynus ATCC 38327]|uniref:NAD-dependent epimerase/dehydratase domain-containing protein n=1 Tax=Allomyces macrogynus (strain ATCC 38327) TaxID=578462 RepID=A0A0L0S3M1_ALLM3|nr:hypothetical protein AMAG_02905 [Allomyces macrogynus ATCC 38327]|eukprot:KNE57158.1 hypothetical protein AMAG_02905 [Allomyces macrogynus ATCC 38327]